MWGRKCAFFFLLEALCDSKICWKCVCCRDSAPDPAGGAHDAPPNPLIGLNPIGASTLAPLAQARRRPPAGFLTNQTLVVARHYHHTASSRVVVILRRLLCFWVNFQVNLVWFASELRVIRRPVVCEIFVYRVITAVSRLRARASGEQTVALKWRSNGDAQTAALKCSTPIFITEKPLWCLCSHKIDCSCCYLVKCRNRSLAV